jgi:hypothetical protein
MRSLVATLIATFPACLVAAASLGLAAEAWAAAPQSVRTAPAADDVPTATVRTPDPAAAAAITGQQPTATQPAKVRIGLRLTPFEKIVARGEGGATEKRFVPIEPLRHVLRARLNKVNHFYVGDWHVQTEPTKWVRKTRAYEVRLSIYRRYGAFGQLEEQVGTVDLAGMLTQQPENVFVLNGVARKRLRDRFGQPVLDVVAGYGGPESPATQVARRDAGAESNLAPVAPERL